MTISTDIGQAEPGKSELRRRAILDVAREAFMAQGFAATSMSEIAARLGGSKGTLYNYFRSKEELFAAIMIDTCEGPANAVFDHMPATDGDLRSALIELGCGFMSFLLSPPSMSVHRLVVAEAHRFPELGRIFYETGPRTGQTKLEEFFRPVIARGQLKPCEPSLAARRFKDLVLSDVYSRRLWGVIEAPTPEQIRAHVTESVDIFLAAFAPAAG
ncbi:MAG: TetR/AcrR family transcriptional regulator [Caulobacteraceae bacterium]|nr:TetR/AcrR family transcriptional regulator [Caulobacteraceae bacterium]